MAAAVRINKQPGHEWLGFDLREVMNAVGPHPELDWWLYNAYFQCDVTSVWPEGIGIEEQTQERPGLAVDWPTMEQVAGVCHQFIDACFTGYDERGEPRLQLAVVDSSFWRVWSDDDAVLDAVRAAFASVEADAGPAPPPLDASGR